ncbi:MAG: 50S ribosomal protein L35, partial [Planctomycetota bacterium]
EVQEGEQGVHQWGESVGAQAGGGNGLSAATFRSARVFPRPHLRTRLPSVASSPFLRLRAGSAATSAAPERPTMTKQKTKKAVVKRMKLTKTGKVKFRHAYTSHLLVRRSSKRKRQLRQKGLCKGKIAVNMAELLGGR